MPTFIKTYSFISVSHQFNHEKDDKKVNEILKRIQDEGGQVKDIKVQFSGGLTGGISALYLITYSAPYPII